MPLYILSNVYRRLYLHLFLSVAQWYAEQDPDRFTFHVGEAVTSIDSEGHKVTTDKGRVINYDYCVLATGSSATVPSYVDVNIPGVFVYRNISDMNRLLAYADKDDIKGSKVNYTPLSLCAHSG